MHRRRRTRSLGASRRQRQHRIFAIKRLDRGFLVDAEYRCMLRRMQIQTDNLCGFGFKVRVVRRHVAFEPVRAQRMLAPDARHHHMGNLQLLTEFAGAPMGRSVARFALRAPLKDPRLECRRQSGGQLAGVTAEKPRQSFLRKSLTPAINEAVGAIELRADDGPRLALIQQQNQPRAARLISTSTLAIRSPGKLFLFHCRQFNRVAHAYDRTLFSVVTGH
jgi:hypothetical protein